MADNNLTSISDIAQQSVDFNQDNWAVDADTIKDKSTGELKRVAGLQAPEISKVYEQDGELQFKEGTAGGNVASNVTIDLAKQLGYTNVVDTGEKGAYGRGIVSLQNDEGDRLESDLIANQVYDVNQFTLQEDILRRDAIRALGNQYQHEHSGRFAEAADLINEGIAAEGGKARALKLTAMNEAEYAANPELFHKGLLYSHSDRNLKNESKNPFSTSWGLALNNTAESFYGAASALGDALDDETLQQLGDAGTARVRDATRNSPLILTDYKDIESAGDTLEFIGNNAIMSLPYMAATIGGALLAPVTYGTSLAVPLSLYAGQIYNEQDADHKNVTHAVLGGAAQAVIDRFALGKLTAGAGFKEVFEGAVKKRVAQGVTKEAAEAEVNAFTKQQLAGFMRESGDVLKRQLSAKNSIKNVMAGVARGTMTEAPTEAVQEAIGYVAANLDSPNPLNYEEMMERMIQGAVAGGAIGGAFGGAGATADIAKWHDAVHRTSNVTEQNANKADQRRRRAEKQDGTVQSVDEILEELDTPQAFDATEGFDPLADTDAPELQETGATWEDRVNAGGKQKAERGTADKAYDILSGTNRLWRATLDITIPPEMRDRSPTVNKMYDLLYGGRDATHSGADFETFKKDQVTVQANKLVRPQRLFAAVMGGRKDPAPEFSAKRGEAPSVQLQAAIKSAEVSPGVYDVNKIPENVQGRAEIINYIHGVQAIATDVEADIKRYAQPGEVDGMMSGMEFLTNAKSVKPEAIVNNKAEFIESLSTLEHAGKQIGVAKAREIADILSGGQVNTIEEAANFVLDTPANPLVPTVFSRIQAAPEFDQYFQKNAYNNMLAGLSAYANYTAHQKYVGNNFQKPNRLLERAVKNGEISEAEANTLALKLNDYFQAERGQYKRFKSDAGVKFDKLQKNLMFLTTITSLPLSAVSSLVEIATTTMGGVATVNQAKQGGKELGAKFAETIKATADAAKGKAHEQVITDTRQRVEDLGLGGWIDDVAVTVGATQGDVSKQNILSYYFKINQLKDVTQATRAIRLAAFADYFADKTATILQETGYQYKSKERLDAESELASIGLDLRQLGRLSDLAGKQAQGVELSPEDQTFFDGQMNLAEQRFINQAVALPGTANRPLFYSDPRFRLVTHLQGFISTFTANQIPRMWNQYIKQGSPSVKYQTFATMMTMVALGFATQELKDWIRYGDGQNYLEPEQEIRRGIASSGLLGVGERALEVFAPLYDKQSDSILESTWEAASAQSPVLSKAGTVKDVIADTAEGDKQGAVNNFLKVFGTPTQYRHDFVDTFVK